MMKKTIRTRNWISILYPESANENWKELISQEMVSCLVSPLHDKDVNDVDDEIKKEHYHILIMFDGPKTFDQAQFIFNKIGAINCKPCNSVRGSARYFCHLDNPDKYQYSVSDVIAYGGVDYLDLIDLPSSKYNAIREMMDYCKQNNIVSYAILLEYASLNNPSWFRILCDNGTVVMKEYLKSKLWTNAYNKKN